MRLKSSKGAGGFYARRDAMVDAAIFDDRLSRSSIRVFSAIKRHWRPDNLTAFPGRGLIAQIAKCDDRTVTRAIAELREHGYIIVTRGGRKGDRYTMPEGFGNSDDNVVISEAGNSDKSVRISEGNSDIPEPKFRQNDAAPYREAEDETEGAKTPPASSAPDYVLLSQSSTSEGVGFVADDSDDPTSDCGPKEDDEPIIDPPDDPRPLPEIPASLEDVWRRADEQADPPEPREAEDDPDDLEPEDAFFGPLPDLTVDTYEDVPERERAEFHRLADLLDADPRAFVDRAFAAFSGGDEDAERNVVEEINRRVRTLRRDKLQGSGQCEAQRNRQADTDKVGMDPRPCGGMDLRQGRTDRAVRSGPKPRWGGLSMAEPRTSPSAAFDFDAPPPLGHVLQVGRRFYTLVGSRPITRRDGKPSFVLTWERDGETYTTGLRGNGFYRQRVDHA